VATNVTVSVGTIDGLIFYANIVQPNKAIFFPDESSSSFLSVFIAWLNLDLGIETCFCNGLDAYAKTWLQFVFPIYIWLIMIMIVIFSHYSTTVARLSGRNAVPVLATLFLLSYGSYFALSSQCFHLLYWKERKCNRKFTNNLNYSFRKIESLPPFQVQFLMILRKEFGKSY